MMFSIIKAFKQQPWYKDLDLWRPRRETFGLMIEHVEKAVDFGLTQIIETGTARTVDNWSGDGQSTLIWDWLASKLDKLQVLSIDKDPEAIATAQQQTSRVDYLCGESYKVLSTLPIETLQRVALLYLDSYDWSPATGKMSSAHHLEELLAVWSHLPFGAMIAVDDVISKNEGKHIAISQFMMQKRIPLAFEDYQVAWVKNPWWWDGELINDSCRM